jgi:beta-lactamase regulating signal transducer with metallopeptidase domain
MGEGRGEGAFAFSNEIDPGRRQIAAQLNVNWLIAAFGIWCGGILLVLVSIAIGQVWLRKVGTQSEPLHEWKPLLDEFCKALGLRREVRLLRATDDIMPLTWGWLKPVVVLPAEAAEWSDQRRRVVLLHELAHVKRRDCLTSFLTRLVCALFWFNPLVWIAARQMRAERERAADDLVLNGGCKPSDYAAQLVDIARSFRRVPQVAGIAMARASGLETRVAAIVDRSRIRRLRPIAVWTF